MHTLGWPNDIHACNKGFIHNSKGLLLANSQIQQARIEQNRMGDKMGNNTGSTNMAERIIRLWLSETEMIACGAVSELDAF